MNALRSLTAALLLSLPLAACATEAASEEERGDGSAVVVGDDKGDGTIPLELAGRLRPTTPVDAELSSATPRIAHVFYAAAGSQLDLEVTRTGSAAGLDTVLRIAGPRLADGTYQATVQEDDDAGYGKLSRLSSVTLATEGFYLAEVATKPGATLPAAKKFRLALTCATCDTAKNPGTAGLDITWTDRSAEFRAAAAQAYASATTRLDALAAEGLPAAWAVSLDVDETVLSNVIYQRERFELGTGYSSPSWLAWTKRKAATPLPGAVAFVSHVRALGGTIVLVTNRKAVGECAPTEENLAASGVPYDAILCRTGASDKNPRFESIEDGTAKVGLGARPVVMFVGDNILDFPNLSQELRKESIDAFADFGDRFFLLPNPMYGSWEKNLD